MASPFIEQIMSMSIASRDPEVKAAVGYLESQAQDMKQDLLVKRSTTIEVIEAKLQQAVDNGSRSSVIQAYESLLALAVS